MDLYIGGTREVSFDVGIVPESPTVILKGVDNGADYTMNTVAIDGSQISFTLPYKFSREHKTIPVEITYGFTDDGVSDSFTMDAGINVIQPILPLTEIQAILGSTATADEVNAIERSVRLIIQANTGQQFGYHKGSYELWGSGASTLELPQRAISLNTVNGWGLSPVFKLSDNRLLVVESTFYPNQFHEYTAQNGDSYSTIYYNSGVIIAPESAGRKVFAPNNKYIVDGEWGWKEVPDDVQDAARLLVNDYACMESMYRDRYLANMSSTDWSLKFDTRSWQSTGNVRADQLLLPYKVHGGRAVI